MQGLGSIVQSGTQHSEPCFQLLDFPSSLRVVGLLTWLSEQFVSGDQSFVQFLSRSAELRAQGTGDDGGQSTHIRCVVARLPLCSYSCSASQDELSPKSPLNGLLIGLTAM